MNIITIASILVTFCALASYANHRFLQLPPTIGVMVIALLVSTAILFLPDFGVDVRPVATRILKNIDFSETFLHGMLSFLLFAGAMHINVHALKKQKYIIMIMAVFSTLLSTFLVGGVAYYLFPMVGVHITLIYALIFGALISPTDPIAVMAILKKAKIPLELEAKVMGESLFNDGIAVVLFIVLLGINANGDIPVSAPDIILLFIQQAFGGMALGLALGYITFLMLRNINNYQVEVLLTLALVMGGYELALPLHTSGPLAMVVAGLFIGNKGSKHGLSKQTQKNIGDFWKLIDELLNSILFLLMGLVLIVLPFNKLAFYAGCMMIPSLLLIRYISVFIPIVILRNYRTFTSGAATILTWGGLRGGLSVAMVLSLDKGEIRDFLLLTTYCIVMFSIIGQGLTIGDVARSVNSSRRFAKLKRRATKKAPSAQVYNKKKWYANSSGS